MRLFQKKDKPLRIYLEGDSTSLTRLLLSLNSKFYYETDYSKEDDIDNIIFCEDDEFYFPVGILSIITSELTSLAIDYIVDIDGSEEIYQEIDISPDLLEGITLREYQIAAIECALKYKKGLLQIPTGGGKTEVMTGVSKYLLDKAEGHIMICVPTALLLHQTYERLIERGIPESEVFRYGDGFKLEGNKRICVATVQTAYKRLSDESFQNWYKDLKCLLVDEAHHLACRTWYTLIDRLAPEYNLGVSAEPFYGDKSHIIRDLILRGTVGSVLYRIPIKYLIDKGYLSKPYMVAMETQYPGDIYNILNWHTINKLGIVQNKLRNKLIKSIALSLISAKKNPLILVQQINHGNELAKIISEEGYKVAVLTGGLKVTIYMNGHIINTFRDSEGITKKEFQEGLVDAMIGTSTMDEGVDVPVLSSVILAGGGKSKLKLLQRVGRGLRCKPGDNTTIIIDFQDKFSIVLHSQFKKRKTMFSDQQIPVYFCKNVDNFGELVQTIIEQRLKEISVSNS